RALADHGVASAFLPQPARTLEHLRRGLHAVGRSGRDEDELVEPRGVVDAKLHADDAAHAVAAVGEAAQPEVIRHADDIAGVLLDRIAVGGMAAVARAAPVHDDAAVA